MEDSRHNRKDAKHQGAIQMSATIHYWDNDKPEKIIFGAQHCTKVSFTVPTRTTRTTITAHGTEFRIKINPAGLRIDSDDGVVWFEQEPDGTLYVGLKSSAKKNEMREDEILSRLPGAKALDSFLSDLEVIFGSGMGPN